MDDEVRIADDAEPATPVPTEDVSAPTEDVSAPTEDYITYNGERIDVARAIEVTLDGDADNLSTYLMSGGTLAIGGVTPVRDVPVATAIPEETLAKIEEEKAKKEDASPSHEDEGYPEDLIKAIRPEHEKIFNMLSDYCNVDVAMKRMENWKKSNPTVVTLEEVDYLRQKYADSEITTGDLARATSNSSTKMPLLTFSGGTLGDIIKVSGTALGEEINATPYIKDEKLIWIDSYQDDICVRPEPSRRDVFGHIDLVRASGVTISLQNRRCFVWRDGYNLKRFYDEFIKRKDDDS